MANAAKDNDEIAIMAFINDRTNEMKAMLASQSEIVGNNLVQQQLPRHMRRRAASHKANRLPIRLRQRYLFEQQKSGDKKITKRPSRKFRRQPKNIFAEFARRQNNGLWLETHVWHAKRFRMAKKWGWKIAMQRNDRGERAAYRNAKNQCLIQDISYMTCLEIIGDETEIISNLNQLIGINSGPHFDSKMYIEGLREGQTFIYKRDSFPTGAIGPLRFLWQPRSLGDSARRMWNFIHPSCLKEVLEQIESFSWTSNCSYKQLNNEISRFRLTGPSSQKVLLNTLSDYSFSDLPPCEDDSESYLSTRTKLKDSLETQLSSNIVIGGLATDPRFGLPPKKMSTWDLDAGAGYGETWTEANKNLARSYIWDEKFRNDSKNSKASTHEFNQLKERYLTTDSLISAYQPRIPILLVASNDPNSTVAQTSQHLDLIIPSAWSMVFWIGLIYKGGHSIGHNEMTKLQIESNIFPFPINYPDTLSGSQEENELGFEAYRKYRRRPPAKRCNYARSGVVSCFGCPWKRLVSEWNKNGLVPDAEFYCLRDFALLKDLQAELNKKFKCKKGVTIVRKSKSYKQKLLTPVKCPPGDRDNCLVPVFLKSLSRGLPKQYAGIYLMVEEDFTQNSSIIKECGHEETDQSMYPRRRKKDSTKNKSVRTKTKADSSCLINVDKSIDTSTLANKTIDDQKVFFKQRRPKISPLLIEGQLKADYERDRKERLNAGLRHLCSRQLIGFVVSGGFSYLNGVGTGLGYVTLEGFRDLIKSVNTFSPNYSNELNTLQSNVLFRNTTSYVYHRAILNVAI